LTWQQRQALRASHNRTNFDIAQLNVCYKYAMPDRAYGQFCAFSRALEDIGERWALMIVRDLLVAPKRFTELHRGLVGISTNVLTERLKELETNGIVRRTVLPQPDGSIVYELTEAGLALEQVVDAIGCWGAKRLDAPRDGEVVTADGFATALRTTFQRSAARGLHMKVEVRIGDAIAHAHVDDGTIRVGTGSMDDPDLTIVSGPALRAIMAGELAPVEAVRSGLAQVSGNTKLFDRFGELFRF
jgi:DNA-binding HxlR family transcriptional regulator